MAASLQAPRCIPGWLTKYNLNDLDVIIKSINKKEEILCWFGLESFDWEHIVKLLFSYVEKDHIIHDHRSYFSKAWEKLSNDFLSEKYRSEYNSLKHGFRNSSGGFWLRFGLQKEENVPVPPEKTNLMGGNKFGSSYFMQETFKLVKWHLD